MQCRHIWDLYSSCEQNFKNDVLAACDWSNPHKSYDKCRSQENEQLWVDLHIDYVLPRVYASECVAIFHIHDCVNYEDW